MTEGWRKRRRAAVCFAWLSLHVYTAREEKDEEEGSCEHFLTSSEGMMEKEKEAQGANDKG